MKKILYIIPGLKETTRCRPYQSLKKIADKKGYEVVCKNVNWDNPLYPQIFPVSKNAVVFGFSLGAVLAWLVAQNYECKHLILASMTPSYSWKNKKIRKALVEIVGLKFVNDVTKNLTLKHKALKQTILYGDLEEEQGDVIVHNTEHELNDKYIKEIAKML